MNGFDDEFVLVEELMGVALVETMILSPLFIFIISTGFVELDVPKGSPIFENPLSPQHFISPVDVIAQACSLPTAISVTPEVKPITSTGTFEGVVFPLPNCHLSLYPQHFTHPAEVRTQFKLSPAIALTPDVSPGISS